MASIRYYSDTISNYKYLIVYYSSLLVFAFIFYNRFICLKDILSNGRGKAHIGTDVSAQFFFFLKSLTQKSLCPNVFQKTHPKGSLYYPLGIYWVATNLSLFFKKNNRSPITYSDLKDPNHYSSLALKFVIALNVLILPIISITFIGIIPFLIIENNVYAAVLSFFSLIYSDLYFPAKPYTVQTRSIGFCASYILCSTILILISHNFNPLAFDFSQDLAFLSHDIVLQNLFRVNVYSISIISLASLLFISFRSSQQGSQFIISMLLTVCILLPSDFLIPVISSVFLTISLPLSQVNLDSLNFFRAHLNNWINESAWYLRTYGPQKYKFLQVNSIAKWSYFKQLFSFNIDPSTGNRHAAYKSSWFLQLMENRGFLYSLYFISFYFLSGQDINYDSKFILLLFTTVSCIAPSILCCTRFFQGYGPPLHYIEFFTPFNYISLFAILSTTELLAVPNPIKYILLFDFCACLSRLIISFIKKKILLFRSQVNLKVINKDDDRSYISKYMCSEEKFIVDYIHNIKIEKSNANLKLAAAKAGHYQMIIEVACLMASNQYEGLKSQFYLNLIAFPYIDSNNYSFYNNWQWILTIPESLQQYKVTHLFINLNSNQELLYAQNQLMPRYKSDLRLIKSNTQLSIMKLSGP